MAKFSVSYQFRGTATDIVEAEDLDAAKEAIAAKVDGDNFDLEPDQIDDVDFYVQQLHPVSREGSELWVTLIRPGDLRGHPSALLTTPLFAPAANDNKEAALGAVA